MLLDTFAVAPTRGRELKLVEVARALAANDVAPPTRGRELKCAQDHVVDRVHGRPPTRGRELKCHPGPPAAKCCGVAPHAGA